MKDIFDSLWLGKDVDFQQIWDDFNSAAGYIKKFEQIQPSLVTVNFDSPIRGVPVFNHYAVLQSFNGLYHDAKKFYLPDQYDDLNPLYLYSVQRGSAEWAFMLEPEMLNFYVSVLLYGLGWYQGKRSQDNMVGEVRHNKDQIIEEIRRLKVDPDKVAQFFDNGDYAVVFQNFNKFDPNSILLVPKLDSYSPVSEYRIEIKNKPNNGMLRS